MGLSSRRNLLAAAILLLAMTISSSAVRGFPSGLTYPPTFTQKNGDWYDSWGIDRNYYGGTDGYMPNIAYETLGQNSELAYSIGEQFKTAYSSTDERAEAILKYVQTWTNYGYDSDNVVMNGVPQEEWAWNADEMAHRINETTGTVAIGDCEDLAFLCATLYIAAGFDVTMVLAPSHVALLIWLPDYPNANYYWDIGDGRGAGWIWVESTGSENPLGWTPPDFSDGNWDAYPLASTIYNVVYDPQAPGAGDDVTVTASIANESGQISQVILDYSTDGANYKALPMTLEESSYQATIPKQPAGTVVDFHISMTDTEGNTLVSGSFSYTVGGGMQIPGFPLESIIIGFIIGLALLYFIARKRPAPTGQHTPMLHSPHSGSVK